MARTDIPIVVQRYSRTDVVLVPLWEWQFFKDMEAAMRERQNRREQTSEDRDADA